MQLRSTEIKELPANEVLYLKKWQSNKYYPIEVAERVIDGWITYCVSPDGRKMGTLSYTDRAFLYKLQHNIYFVSDTPMSNTEEFNFE